METKPFYYTSEFWVTVLANVASIVTAVSGYLPVEYLPLAIAASNAAYALSRGMAKSGVPPEPSPPAGRDHLIR